MALLNNQEKESKIADLKKQIKELENDREYNYELIKVIPDCGGGVKDSETTICISTNFNDLVNYCIKRYDYEPKWVDNYKRPNDGLAPCDTWYRIDLSEIEII